MKKFVLATAFVWILLSGHKPKSESVVWLKNDQIQVGILVDVGGRVVWTSLLGHENLLLSDSAQWSQPESMRPEMTPNKPFMAYNGHINWLSPQSEWWIKQDSFPKLKERRAEFPPILIGSMLATLSFRKPTHRWYCKVHQALTLMYNLKKRLAYATIRSI